MLENESQERSQDPLCELGEETVTCLVFIRKTKPSSSIGLAHFYPLILLFCSYEWQAVGIRPFCFVLVGNEHRPIGAVAQGNVLRR